MAFSPYAPAAPPPPGYPTRRSPRVKAIAASDRRLRVKLSEGVVRHLQADWERHGAAAIQRLREDHLPDYVKAVLSILPKQAQIEVTSDGPLVVFDFRGREASQSDPLTVAPEDGELLKGDAPDEELVDCPPDEPVPTWASEESNPW
jgi:hypothetical protein